MRRIGVIVLLLLLSAVVHAQSARDLLVRVQKEYLNVIDLDAQMNLTVYEGTLEGPVLYSTQFSLYKKGNKSLYIYSGGQMLINERMFISVNEAMQQIICRPTSDNTFDIANKMMSLPDIDSLLTFYTDLKIMEDQSEVWKLGMVQKEGIVDELTVTISKSDYTVKELTFRYRKEMLGYEQISRLVYEHFDTSPELNDRLFDENHFVVRQNGTYQPTKKYESYEVYFIDENAN